MPSGKPPETGGAAPGDGPLEFMQRLAAPAMRAGPGVNQVNVAALKRPAPWRDAATQRRTWSWARCSSLQVSRRESTSRSRPAAWAGGPVPSQGMAGISRLSGPKETRGSHRIDIADRPAQVQREAPAQQGVDVSASNGVAHGPGQQRHHAQPARQAHDMRDGRRRAVRVLASVMQSASRRAHAHPDEPAPVRSAASAAPGTTRATAGCALPRSGHVRPGQGRSVRPARGAVMNRAVEDIAGHPS